MVKRIIPLVSVRKNRTLGIDCLDSRGFTAFKKENRLEKEIQMIFKMMFLYLNKYLFLGFDPVERNQFLHA